MSNLLRKLYVEKANIQIQKTGAKVWIYPGTTTLGAEVTNISGHCVWTVIDNEELALPYSEFPLFKAATIQQILNVLRPTPDHLYWHWPDLDVDLSVESIS